MQDDLGSPIRVLGEEGIEQEVYGYDEFGQETINIHNHGQEQGRGSLGFIQPFTYTGYQKDNISNTYYAQAREYQAGVGHFASKDVDKYVNLYERVTLNQYLYCNDNPMKYIDPTGFVAEDDTSSVELLNLLLENSTVEIVIDFSLPQYNVFVDGLDITNTIIGAWLRASVAGATRPNNIGAGAWNKAVNQNLDDIARITGSYSKAIKGLGYVGVVVDVGVGINENIKNGASTDRIASDAVVDGAFSVGSLAVAGKAGAIAGTIVPGAGTAVGAVVGMAGHVITDSMKINGKSLKDYTKDGFSALNDMGKSENETPDMLKELRR